ncbi:MAG: OmpH family outer membrane protein [Gemmatimonadota bacterium]
MPGYIVWNHIRRGAAAAALGAVACLATGASPLIGQETPIRIAVVDMDFIAVQSPAGKNLATEITELQNQYNIEMGSRQAVVDGIQARIAAVDSADVAEQRVLQREYQDAVTSFQRYQQDMRAQAQSFQNEGLTRVREEIGPALEAIMVEEGYDLILNTGNPAVVMSSDRVDITQLVLERLEAGGTGG